jgi:RimJ/RimL family protein N-acetyltransferase
MNLPFERILNGDLIIETPRFRLVPMSEEHADDLVSVLIEPDGKELSTWGYFHGDTAKRMRPRDGVTARDVVINFIRSARAECEAGKRVPLTAIDKIDGKAKAVISAVDIVAKHERCTLGWGITGPEYRGQKVIEEAAIWMIDWLFKAGCIRIQADVSAENRASIKAASLAGLQIEGRRPKHMKVAFQNLDGTQQRHDMLLMGMLAEDWLGAAHQMDLLMKDSTNG